MNKIKVFENPEFGSIRTVEQDGEPWLAGKDVAAALGYSNPRDAISKHVDDEDKGVAKCDT
ncbi:MAG: Bro-N domain-containing protein, partial [Clostridiales bacterium]|nr:Bro-N domain-containing protein [Clostridiales bacterium]